MLANKIRTTSLSLLAASFALGASAAYGASSDEELFEKKQEPLHENHREYVYGVPNTPTAFWNMSAGGRLYDNWMTAKDSDEPDATHPSWPASNTKKSGSVTWRCKSCHGWDYKGVNGKYSGGSYKTGIAGVVGFQGRNPGEMVAILRNDVHQYSQEMLTDDEAVRLGTFVARGLHDTDAYIDREAGNANGSAARGAGIFQNVCAACHGFQGTKLDWGDADSPAYIGTEANANSWEVLHKIRNGHPSVEMISMRPFGIEAAIDVLTYVRTLPEQ